MGGSVHTLTEIDLDKLSFFEIQDLCHLVGAPKEHSRYRYLLPEGDLKHNLRVIKTDPDVVNMTTLHRAWSADKIIIYTDIDVEPLAVEHPDGGGVTDDDVGGDGEGVAKISGDVGGDGGVDEIDLENDYDEVVCRKKKMLRMIKKMLRTLRMLRLVQELKNKMLRSRKLISYHISWYGRYIPYQPVNRYKYPPLFRTGKNTGHTGEIRLVNGYRTETQNAYLFFFG